MSSGARGYGGYAGFAVRCRCVGAPLLAIALISLHSVTLAGDSASVDAVRHDLRAALAKSRDHDDTATVDGLKPVILAPAFTQLTTSEQHAALAVAASGSLRLKRQEDAGLFAARAVSLPEQSVDDWRVRLFASVALGDVPVEVESLTTIGRLWRIELTRLPTGTIMTVANDARLAQFGDNRREMLEQLFEIRLRRADGGEPSRLWRDLSLLLLEAGKPDEAIAVATHITDPFDIVAMRADKRYEPILRSDGVPHNVRRAANTEVDRLALRVQRSPRLLEPVKDLLGAMVEAGQTKKALDLMDEVTRRVEAAPTGTAPYDDVDSQYGWVLKYRATALQHLGRYNDAVLPLQQAVQWASDKKSADQVSHAIDLASLLCRLDRPQEALAVLARSPADRLRPFGRMQAREAQLMAEVELQDSAAIERSLTELREQSPHSFDTLQHSLAIAGRDEEAAALMLRRLQSPQLRTDALVDLQDYIDVPLPPRSKEWQARVLRLRDRPEIRSVLGQVGKIERYPLF